MKNCKFILAGVLSCFALHACIFLNNEDILHHPLTKTDSTWLKFAKAINSNDTIFLIQNSLDSIECGDCGLPEVTNDLYEKRYILIEHLKELKHLDSLSIRNFSTFEQDSLIQVIYNIKSCKAPEGGYSLIFILLKRDNKYFLIGSTKT